MFNNYDIIYDNVSRLKGSNEMNYVMKEYEPATLWKHFENLSAIPRGSGNEKAAADYIEDFAKKHGLECIRDYSNNILIRKKASAGYEEKEPVLLQGHMDMVCEKNSDKVHDFEKDPLELYVEDGALRARGTTLGGDDGIAVAAMLSILEEDHAHPELECLFTTDEEVGMSGAKNFDYENICATRLINLDSEEENTAVVSCAGGARIEIKIEHDRMPLNPACSQIEISITGLAGGHSGEDINSGRANAVNTMGILLGKLYDDSPMRLIEISGGNKDNAIPRECRAVVSVRDRKDASEKIKEYGKIIKNGLAADDKGFTVRVKNTDSQSKALTFADTSKVISAMLLFPCGVINMSPYDGSMPETSCNLGVIRGGENGTELRFLARSSSEDKLNNLIMRYKRLAGLLGACVNVADRYPGWEYSPDGRLQRDYLEAVRSVCGDNVKAKITSIHAGLECGVITSSVKHPLDAISIGPRMENIHTPDESLDIESVGRFWKILLELLKK